MPTCGSATSSRRATCRFDLTLRGRRLRRSQLDVPGAHNALNAAGAFAVLVGLGFDPRHRDRRARRRSGAPSGGSNCTDVVRGVSRLRRLCPPPAEVAAALSPARGPSSATVGSSPMHQPHLYSRTQVMARRLRRGLRGARRPHDRARRRTAPARIRSPGVTGAAGRRAFRDPSRSTTCRTGRRPPTRWRRSRARATS